MDGPLTKVSTATLRHPPELLNFRMYYHPLVRAGSGTPSVSHKVTNVVVVFLFHFTTEQISQLNTLIDDLYRLIVIRYSVVR